jgi:CheY-like chemotaxis protein/HPt (histidine-containing phosphotransfer) domain-containing protein
VQIHRGRRRSACADNPDVISLEGNGLSRKGLLRSVAIAVGRASPLARREPTEEDLTGALVAPSVPEARAQGRLILVAEDDAVNQTVILQQLALLGYAAEVADNGAEALDLWRDGGYALLLTDLHMPVMDGYQLAAAIRREETGTRLPILALSANALRHTAQLSETADMDDYLTKPVQLTRLERALERWLPADSPMPAGTDSMAAAEEAVSSPATEAKVVDLAVLKDLVGDDPAIIHNLLASYREAARGYAAALHDAGEAGDLDQVSAVAHKVKSASRSVGALALGDLCASLENAAKTGDNKGVRHDLPGFETAFAAVDEAIARLTEES